MVEKSQALKVELQRCCDSRDEAAHGQLFSESVSTSNMSTEEFVLQHDVYSVCVLSDFSHGTAYFVGTPIARSADGSTMDRIIDRCYCILPGARRA